MTVFEQFAEQAGLRSQGYWLVSTLLLAPPTSDLLADLQVALRGVQDAASDQPAVLSDLSRAVEEAAKEPDAAAVGFTRYLVLVSKESGESFPFESHVREGRLPGEATEQVASLLNAWGYAAVAPDAGPPDHLGAELRLLALLCLDERQAWLDGQRSAAVTSLRRQRQFLSEHLADWAPTYCMGLAERAENGYVKAIARIVAQTIRDDLAALEEICLAVDGLPADADETASA